MTVTIVGLGLMGCSMAIDLKKTGFTKQIIGVDINKQDQETALRNNYIDRAMNLYSAIKDSDIIILAVPVDVISKILPSILDLSKGKVVTDLGSVKYSIEESIKNHKNRKNFVSGHPIAGTENSGVNAAVSNLFNNKVVILCDKHKSLKEALEKIEKMYQFLNMNILYMNSKEHDIHCAYVSHISHLSSFALALSVLDKEKDEENILNLAGGGFESTVRLAKSNAQMWNPIFINNKYNIIEVLDNYINKLNDFKKAIKSEKIKELNELILQANKISKIV
jgi:prephenate dehydrogenase